MSAIPHHTSDAICPLCEYKLAAVDPTLQYWFRQHIKPNFPDAHISWGYRNETEQEQAYLDHKTRLHYPQSDHNKIPAKALDLFEINDAGQGVWNPGFFSAINDYNEDHGIELIWGAKWRSLGDNDHFAIPNSHQFMQQ